MPQLMYEPAATLLKKADGWQEEEWIVTPKNDTDTVHALRAAGISGNGSAQSRTFSGQPYGFLRGNRLVKDIVLGLYDQALVGGTPTLQRVNGVKTGWSRKSVLADLLATRYAELWLPAQNGKWEIYNADQSVRGSYDTLKSAITDVIYDVIAHLSLNGNGGNHNADNG